MKNQNIKFKIFCGSQSNALYLCDSVALFKPVGTDYNLSLHWSLDTEFFFVGLRC